MRRSEDDAEDSNQMVSALTVIDELDTKNQTSFQRLASSYIAALDGGGFTIVDVLRLVMKSEIEAADVAALWLVECEELELKLMLAEQCGTAAGTIRALRERAAAAGGEVATIDPREGGYGKLFAFLRSLQTSEERLAAEHLTRQGLNVVRTPALAAWCEQHGDAGLAQYLRDAVLDLERSHYERGRAMLATVASTEESQARARRAAFRVIELIGDMSEPGYLRKTAGKRR